MRTVLGLRRAFPDHLGLSAISLIAPHPRFFAVLQIRQHHRVGYAGRLCHRRVDHLRLRSPPASTQKVVPCLGSQEFSHRSPALESISSSTWFPGCVSTLHKPNVFHWLQEGDPPFRVIGPSTAAGFVGGRVVTDMDFLGRPIGTAAQNDLSSWVNWALPVMVVEIVLQIGRLRKTVRLSS
jgi:hypothetical protein